MKKVMKKFNRALSIMLVAAMVLTMAPQTAMPVLAAEGTVETDASVENGEAVVGETVGTPETGEIEEVADPSDEENFNTEGDDISSDDPADEESVVEEPVDDTEEPAEAEDAANDPMSAEPYALTAADVVAPTGTGFKYAAGENTDVAANGFTFTVTAETNYTVDSVKYQVADGEETPATAGADSTYTIPAEVFAANAEIEAGTKVKILVTATRIQYMVTPTVTVTKTAADTEAPDSEIVDFSWTAATEGADVGKIYAGDTLKFTAKLKAGKDAAYSIAVSYQVGTATAVTPEIAKTGVYTIANVDGAVTINVTVAPLKQCEITVAENPGIQKVEYLKDGKYVEYDKVEKPVVTENQEFKFKVTAAAYYKVDKVTVGDAVVTATNGVYTTKITDDTTITVTTSIDATKCNTLTFALDKNSDPKSASATISISANDIGELNGQSLEAGEKVTIPGDDVTLKIAPKDGYTVTKVNGTTVTPDEDGVVEYKVPKFTNKKATVTVTTDTKGSVSENALITFEMNNAPKLSYKVTGESINPVAGEANQYRATKDTKRLKFTVTAAGSYIPTVTQATITTDGGTAGEGVVVEASKTTMTATGATYDYIIPVSKLGYGATFTIEQKENNKTVTIGGDGFANVDIVASINGMKRNPDADSENKKYTVLLNDVVTLQIKAGKNSDLTEVVSKIGANGKETKATIANNTATVEVKVTDDTTIDITTKDQYVASVLKQVKDSVETDLTPVDAAKNSYNVAYDGTYKASVVKGASETDVELSDVKVLLGKNPVAAVEGKTVGSIAEKVATIDLNNAVTSAIAGKTLTVELYAKEGTEEDAKDVKVATYSLNVTVPAKDIKINTKAELKVNQAIDTTKTYTVTAAKGVDLSTLTATKEDTKEIISDMDYDDGKLTVVMAAKAPADAKATITVAAGTDAKATIEITPVKLIADNAKAPTVKLVAATDVSFKLALSAKTEEAASKNLYYKVVTTETVSGNDIDKVTYVQKTGDSQNAIVYVSEKKALGDGGEGSYTVTASVVHASEAVVNNTLDDSKVLGASAASKAQTLKTQKPAYEDKLKLKKGKTTVVTGEKDVVIAEPQFNKYTTYATITSVADTTYSGNAALTVEAKDDALGNYVIKASATQNTAIGKHKIQVTASAEGGAYASVATIDVTVVRGIHNLSVDVPSTNLYKAAKKAAKVKATAVYNWGYTGNWVPKNKKVTWEVLAYDETAENNVATTNDGKEVPFTGATINKSNGTVTVDKNFIIDLEPENNMFVIKVTADNSKSFAGKNVDDTPIVGYSKPITISNTGEDIKTLAIVKGGKIMALPTGTKDAYKVQASDIYEGQVVVLTSGASNLKVGTDYTDDLKTYAINLANLTLKSSNQKNVPVYANGWIGVNKVGKVKLTATAKDGSNNKAELSLNITSDETTRDLMLAIIPAHYDEYAYPKMNTDGWNADKVIYNPSEPGTKVISDLKYDASTTPLIGVQVQQKNAEDDYYSNAPDFTDYKLSVSKGGKIVYQWGATAYIATTAKEVTVTLKDVTKNETKNFVLKSDGAQDKPTFKALNKLRSWATVAEQTTEIEVTKLPATIPTTDLVAKVEVDWSAKNAKNAADLLTFAKQLKDRYSVDIADNKGSFTVDFNGDGDNNWVVLNQKSYKVTVTLGTIDGTTFTAKTLPASLTLGVDKVKKFTFKPTTSYTLTTRDAKASAVLTGKTNVVAGDSAVEWTGLMNMNTKGVTNKFTDYFRISSDGKSIEFVGNEIPAKADLSGYITYHAYATKSYYSDSNITNTVKITIKIDDKKTVAKYSQVKVDNKLPETTGLTKGSTVSTKIAAKVGKDSNAAVLSYVTVDSKDNASKDFNVEKGTSDGEIKLTYNGEGLTKNKTYKVKLLIVPEGSYYEDIIDKAASDAQAGLTAQYGVPVTVQIKAVEAPSVVKTYNVTITGPKEVAVGGSAEYEASVAENATPLDNPTVTWELKAAEGSQMAEGTKIELADGKGKLTVSSEQTVGSKLIITASFTNPNNPNGVSNKDYEVTVTAAE